MENSWLNNAYTQSEVTNHQPVPTENGIHDATDSYFDFDIPGSPADESEYARLITSSTQTPQDNASESGYVCASPISSVDNNIATEHSDSSSTDEPFFDPECSDNEQRSLSLSVDYYDCDDSKKDSNVPMLNDDEQSSSSSSDRIVSNNNTESLPKQHQEQEQEPQQENILSTFTAVNTSESINIDERSVDVPDFCAPTQQPTSNSNDANNHQINHVAIKFESTNSISTNDINPPVSGLNEIPKYDPNRHKDTLSVDSFVNGHSSEEEEDPIPRSERFRRSSSLKTGKTPPGTPGRKKIVRFADVLGLDLADVRTFLDEIPRVPKSAFDELITAPEPPISLGQRLDKIIVPLFQQPGAATNFLDTVQLQNVALENAAVTDPICLTITGLVRVRNLDFHKSVHVRYSLDAWESYSDLQAEYVPNSCDGFSDKFSFTVFGNSMEIGQRIEMSLRFSCKGEQFWDNNHGVNYCFQCMPATTPQLQSITNNGPTNNHHDVHMETWGGSSFY